MKHNRKYKLLKDLPDGAIVGDIYVDNGYGRYTNQRMDASKSPVIEHNSYFSWQVETSTDFFEEVNTVEKEGVAWCGIAEQTRCYSNIPDAAVFLKTQFEILQKSKYDNNLKDAHKWTKMPHGEPSSKKEEGWEILSYINPYVITDIKDGNIVKPNIYATLRDYPINSVLRKSDNIVFTVGDEVVRNNYADKIYSFEINGDSMNVGFCGGDVIGFFNLSEVSKAPTNTVEGKPLFVTDDGVSVSEGKMWMVSDYGWRITPVLICSNPFRGVTGNDYKYFSTEEAAKEYVLMNKPQFSISEINKIYPAPLHSPLHNEFEKQLINVAKSKTNNQ